MKKIILIISTSIIIFIQVFVMAQFFTNRYSILLGGDKFKFLVTNLDFNDKRSCVDFELLKNVSEKGNYGVIKIDKNGFAQMDKVVLEKPSFGAYVENSEEGYFCFPYDKYYLTKAIEYDEKIVLPQEYRAHINVRIKEGKVELVNLLVDGKKIEEYIIVE